MNMLCSAVRSVKYVVLAIVLALIPIGLKVAPAHADGTYTVSGHISFGSTPVSGGQIAFTTGQAGGGSGRINSNGDYSVSGLPNGNYYIQIEGQSPAVNVNSTNPAVVVNGADITHNFVFNTSAVTITVKDAAGNLVSDIGASLTNSSSGSIAASDGTEFSVGGVGVLGNGAQTDDNGVATVNIIQGLTYAVCAHADGYDIPGYNNGACGPTNITVNSDTATELDLPYTLPVPRAPLLFAQSPVTNQYPGISWGGWFLTSSINIYRNGVKIDSVNEDNYDGAAYYDSNAPEGNDTYYVTAVNSSGESSPSNSVSIIVDRTAPTLGTPTWTNNPMTTTQSTTATVPVTDNLSGVAAGEYYLGTTDPGQGNGTAMALSGGNLSTSFSSLAAGIYTVNFRAKDNASNWSPVTTDYLEVYDTSNSSADGHSNDIEPIFGTDVLPGLIQTGQTDKEHFAFTVKYKNGTLDTASKVHFVYKTGLHCNNPNQATNCHDTTLDATSFAWMVINGTNNSVATIQGTATLTIDGVTTTNPFRIITTDGSLLNPQTTDHFELDIYAPNANPNTAQPIYHLNDPLAKGNVVVRS